MMLCTKSAEDGRELEPSAAILDSQSVKTTEKGGFLDMTPTNMSRDANGIGGHNGLYYCCHCKCCQDRDGAKLVLKKIKDSFKRV